MTRRTMGCWSLTDDRLDLGADCTVPAVDLTAGTAKTAAGVLAVLRAQIEPGWRHLAACAGTDPDIWFDSEAEDETTDEPSKDSVETAQLLAVCASCPVRRSCLASALLHVESGVWAGTTPSQRHEGAALLAAGHPADPMLDELLTRAADEAKTEQRPQADAGQPGRAA